jgi:lipopolysaccharide export LptBFGC system permease protein LptF
MSSPEEKARLLQEQVIAKIHWDPNEADVLYWLEAEKGVPEDEARRMIAKARLVRHAAVRKKAMTAFVLSAVGATVAAICLGVLFMRDKVEIGVTLVFFIILGIVSLIPLIRSLRVLAAGDVSGPAE